MHEFYFKVIFHTQYYTTTTFKSAKRVAYYR